MADRELKVIITGDASSLQRAMGKASKTGSGLSRSLRNLGKVAAVGVGAAFVGLAATLKVGFDEMEDGQKVAAQTAAVLKSTGGEANVTAKGVDQLATSLSLMSGVDDEVIGAGENMLLTFTNIHNEVGRGNDVFNQATAALLDMSTALGTDMNKSAIQARQGAERSDQGHHRVDSGWSYLHRRPEGTDQGDGRFGQHDGRSEAHPGRAQQGVRRISQGFRRDAAGPGGQAQELVQRNERRDRHPALALLSAVPRLDEPQHADDSEDHRRGR